MKKSVSETRQFLEAVHRALRFLPAGSVFVRHGRDELFLRVGQVGVARDVLDRGNCGCDFSCAKRTDNRGDVVLRAVELGKNFLHDIGGGDVADLFGEVNLLRCQLGGVGEVEHGGQRGGIFAASQRANHFIQFVFDCGIIAQRCAKGFYFAGQFGGDAAKLAVPGGLGLA